MSELPDQLDRLAEMEWDVLVILDAMRWDAWEGHVGVGEPVWSPANCTMEWVKAVFSHAELRARMAGVDCVTANPEVTRHVNEVLLRERDDLWKRGWEYVNGLGTVPPATVTEAVETRLVVGRDHPVYAHYAQPHGPYPMAEPPVPVMRNNPEAGTVEGTEDQPILMDPHEEIEDPDHWLTFDVLRSAYEKNVKWVLDAIEPLLDSDRTVVVTADHGELLGEEATIVTEDGPVTRPMYGHPPGKAHPKLREVPLWQT